MALVGAAFHRVWVDEAGDWEDRRMTIDELKEGLAKHLGIDKERIGAEQTSDAACTFTLLDCTVDQQVTAHRWLVENKPTMLRIGVKRGETSRFAADTHCHICLSRLRVREARIGGYLRRYKRCPDHLRPNGKRERCALVPLAPPPKYKPRGFTGPAPKPKLHSRGGPNTGGDVDVPRATGNHCDSMSFGGIRMPDFRLSLPALPLSGGQAGGNVKPAAGQIWECLLDGVKAQLLACGGGDGTYWKVRNLAEPGEDWTFAFGSVPPDPKHFRLLSDPDGIVWKACNARSTERIWRDSWPETFMRLAEMTTEEAKELYGVTWRRPRGFPRDGAKWTRQHFHEFIAKHLPRIRAEVRREIRDASGAELEQLARIYGIERYQSTSGQGPEPDYIFRDRVLRERERQLGLPEQPKRPAADPWSTYGGTPELGMRVVSGDGQLGVVHAPFPTPPTVPPYLVRWESDGLFSQRMTGEYLCEHFRPLKPARVEVGQTWRHNDDGKLGLTIRVGHVKQAANCNIVQFCGSNAPLGEYRDDQLLTSDDWEWVGA